MGGGEREVGFDGEAVPSKNLELVSCQTFSEVQELAGVPGGSY